VSIPCLFSIKANTHWGGGRFVYFYRSVFHQLTQHAPYVTLTDRRLALRGRLRRRRHHCAVPGRGSSSCESLTSPADEDVAVQRFTDICRTSVVTSLQANRFLFTFSSLSFGDPLDSRALRFILLPIDYCCLLVVLCT